VLAYSVKRAFLKTWRVILKTNATAFCRYIIIRNEISNKEREIPCIGNFLMEGEPLSTRSKIALTTYNMIAEFVELTNSYMPS
jgi:hypothetical protein